MRQKRIKSYRKAMALYQSAFKFREPYQLLVDAAFIQAVTQQKLEFEPRMRDVLQGQVKPMITQCCIKALYDAGPSAQAATDVAKTFERRKCNHLDKPRTEDECMKTMAGKDNPHRYVIATQSLDLRKHLRTVPGTPIIYLNRSVVLLEAPSDQTLARKKILEGAKLHAPAAELALLGKTPVAPSTSSNLIDAPFASTSTDPLEGPTLDIPEAGAEAAEQPKKKKKKRGPSGPNPLSVKKKTKGPAKTEGKAEMQDRLAKERVERKRKRVEDGEAGAVKTMARAGGEGAARKRKRKSRKEAGAEEAAAPAAVEA